MTARTWTYKRLTTFPGLIALIGADDPRVFAKKSMTSSIELHPYIVYKLGNNTGEDLAEDQDVSRQFLQIFVHDYADGEVADYTKIDAVIKQIKLAFKLQSSPADGVIAANYLETSQDLNDETLNTVMKYIRLQLIVKDM
jgi:hypothetical protein